MMLMKAENIHLIDNDITFAYPDLTFDQGDRVGKHCICLLP